MVQILNLALFVPFFVVLLIVGIVYMVSGYKRDLGRSIASICATVVTTLLSILLAKLAATFLAKMVVSKLPESAVSSIGELGGFAKSIVAGMLQIALAFTLFSIFFFIFLIIFKGIARKIKLGILGKLNFGTKASKLGGMGVRTLDAIIVSLFLLMPIYGGIGSLVPTAATMVQMTGAKDSQIADILLALQRHPVLNAYQAGPTDWVSSGLSTFAMNGKSVNVAKAADSIEGVMTRVEKFSKAKGDDKIKAYKELNTYIRENVVEEKWCYDAVMAFLKEFEKQGAANKDMAEAIQIVKPLLKMSYEDFKKTGVAISEFSDYALSEDFVAIAKKGNYTDLPEDFTKRFGKLLNQSNQLISLKKMIFQEGVETLFRTNPDYDSDKATSEAAKFVEKYYGDGKVAENLQQKEAEAFIILMFGGNDLDVLEALARHPLFGTKVAEALLTKEVVYASYHNVSQEELEALFRNNPSLLSTFKTKLKSYGNLSLQQETFSKYVKKTLDKKIGR